MWSPPKSSWTPCGSTVRYLRLWIVGTACQPRWDLSTLKSKDLKYANACATMGHVLFRSKREKNPEHPTGVRRDTQTGAIALLSRLTPDRAPMPGTAYCWERCRIQTRRSVGGQSEGRGATTPERTLRKLKHAASEDVYRATTLWRSNLSQPETAGWMERLWLGLGHGARTCAARH